MNRIQKILIPSAALLLVAAGCAQESETQAQPDTHAVNFTTTDLAVSDTRVLPDNTVFDNGESFGVTAFTSTNGLLSGIGLPNVLYNARVEKYVNSQTNHAGYRYIPTTFWPVDGSKVLFAAYYPHNSTVGSEAITVSPQHNAGLPEYTVILGKHKGRMDFATAEVGPIHRMFTDIDAANPPGNLLNDPLGTPTRKDNYVNFRFKRQMTYLSFRAKAINLPADYRLFINAVFIRNTFNKATYGTTNSATGARGWKNLEVDATTGATLNVSALNSPISKTQFTDIIDPGSTASTLASVVMIPQTYDAVEIFVYYSLEYLKPTGGCESYVTGMRNTPITVDWKPGDHYVYDFELDFSDVLDETVPFRFTVNGWKTATSVDTGM